MTRRPARNKIVCIDAASEERADADAATLISILLLKLRSRCLRPNHDVRFKIHPLPSTLANRDDVMIPVES